PIRNLRARRPRFTTVERTTNANVPPDVVSEFAAIIPVHTYDAVVVHGDGRRHVVRSVDERIREWLVVAHDFLWRPRASLVTRVRVHDLESTCSEITPYDVHAIFEQG